MMAEATGHISVLLKECLGVLEIAPGGLYLDCTFGGGGHTRAILDRADDIRVVAIDKDPAAGERAKELDSAYGERFKFYDLGFKDLDQIEEEEFSGILFDLGVSSFHFDEGERGFSFRKEAPLDMRMDPRVGQSAAEFLETASERELVHAIREYGEERQWRKVVNAIVGARGTGCLQSTTKLAELIEKTIGKGRQPHKGIHPATLVFQGIRIAVNGELMELEKALPKAFRKLRVGGILALISFHSLEDRFVKRYFRKMAGEPEHSRDSVPKDLKESYGKILTRKPITASEEEISLNPRSRSAKLRAFRKERKIEK